MENFVIILHQLERLGKLPDLIIIKKITVKRIINETTRDGFRRIAKKVWRKLILNSSKNHADGSYGTRELLNYLGCSEVLVKNYAKKLYIKCICVSEFDDASKILEEVTPDIGFFAGGGIISLNVLREFNHGVVNTHFGQLPHFRGMDVIEVPILDGYFSSISVISYFMTDKLVEGVVLGRFTINTDECHSFLVIANELRAVQSLLAIFAVAHYLSQNDPQLEIQRGGKQYYFVHPKLAMLVELVIKSRFKTQNNTGIVSLFSEINKWI